jgi:hypothetical protein
MTLRDQLKDIVDNYFNRYPHMSINGLSLKSGVPATTLRRIVNASIKGDPAPHTALNLVSAVTNEKRLSVLVEMYEGPLGKTLNEVFSPYVEMGLKHEYSADLNEELRDSIKYFIYKVSANHNGASVFWVGETFGKLGLDRLAELESAEIVSRQGDSIHASQKDFSLDVHVAARHLPELVKFYKPENIGLGQNLFYTLSESLNEDGIREIKKIQKEAIERIYSVMSDSNFKGDTPYFNLMLSDTVAFEEANLGVCQ